MTALTTRAGWSLPAVKNMADAMRMAELLADSSMVPASYKGKPGDILVAIQMGAELGLAPLQALQNIASINGRPSVWGDAALALVQGHPAYVSHREWVEGEGMERAGYCAITRRGSGEHVQRFSMRDAERAKLLNKPGPWTQYTDRMLVLRARGFAIRDKFSDALRGIITAEEAQDMPPAEPREVPNMVEAPRPAGALAQLQAPTDEVLHILDQDGVEHTIRASKSNPAIMIWMSACRKALGKLEDAGAVREWRAAMGAHMAEIANIYPDEVRSVEDLCAARLEALTPPADEPETDTLGLPE